jgi:cyclopropane-fatty-acyl-phospholipid synthase
MKNHRNIMEQFLSSVGVRIDGHDPWDIQVRDERFYARVLKDGSLGLGESYMEGWWDCVRIDEFICRLLKGNLGEKIRGNLRVLLFGLFAWICNLQMPARATIATRRHYDLGNDLFFSFLDPCNQYSCAYFQGTDDLAEAQRKKLDLICRKIDLQAKDQVLDIGCGWGGYARYTAEHYGCAVTAVNISEEQIRYVREYCKNLPVKILHEDYRRIEGSFDKIVSVGMFEHVGQKNYETFMNVVHRCLEEDGIFLLHTIGCNTPCDSVNPGLAAISFRTGRCQAWLRFAGPQRVSWWLKTSTISDLIMKEPSLPGMTAFKKHGPVSPAGMTRFSSGCGNTIFYPMPGPFAPGTFSFGKSSSQSMASPEAMKPFGEVRS